MGPGTLAADASCAWSFDNGEGPTQTLTVGCGEDVNLRARYGKDKMPRTLNLITGPSRSADIEQTLILGAHGPRKLHIIVVEG